MNHFDKADDPSRRQLIRALTAGFLSTSPFGSAAAFNLFGDTPRKLPENKSIYRLSGNATINETKATEQSIIRPGDTIKTGDNSELIFAVGGHSMILRSNTQLVIENKNDDLQSLLISGLRLIAGKILSVSRNSPMRIKTGTATVGIRGTGWYAEADPEKTYFCTCYGSTEIMANKDNKKIEVEAKHHDQPIYILGNSEGGESLRKAPFINHTDQELMLIETLVGRTTPFIFPKDDYSGPRRDY